MFSVKKGKGDINPGNPQFFVRYVGSTETFTACGKGCTELPVQKIWDNSEEEHLLKRAALLVDYTGITMRYLDTHHRKGPESEIRFDIKDISYCCAERRPHEKIFSWICKDSKARRLSCHAVLCDTPERAITMSVLLSHSFQIAYRDWKQEKVKHARVQGKGKTSGKGKGKSKGKLQNGEVKIQNTEDEEINVQLYMAQQRSISRADVHSSDSSSVASSSTNGEFANGEFTNGSANGESELQANGTNLERAINGMHIVEESELKQETIRE